jgi:hypothetical protein
VHGSNARNLSVQLPLSQLAKTLCLSYYCLYLLFNKIGEKDRTGSAWKKGGGGWGRGHGAGRRNDLNNLCTYEYMNKEKKLVVRQEYVSFLILKKLKKTDKINYYYSCQK